MGDASDTKATTRHPTTGACATCSTTARAEVTVQGTTRDGEVDVERVTVRVGLVFVERHQDRASAEAISTTVCRHSCENTAQLESKSNFGTTVPLTPVPGTFMATEMRTTPGNTKQKGRNRI